MINTRKSVTIKGITDGLQTLGTVKPNLIIDQVTIPYQFHVIPDQTRIPADGILGADFLRDHNCTIDLEKLRLSTKLGMAQHHLDISGHESQEFLILDPRGE